MSDKDNNLLLLQLLDCVRAGDEAAVAELWERCYPHLVRLAEHRLRASGTSQRAFDGEDVAASAMGSFFQAVQKNRFAELRDEAGLFRLLFRMTARKVVDRRRQQSAAKAGGGQLRGESAFGTNDSLSPGLDQVAGADLMPDIAVALDEECERLLDLLDDAELRAIALLRLEGHANAEIATLRGCSLATVERRLKMIRARWSSD